MKQLFFLAAMLCSLSAIQGQDIQVQSLKDKVLDDIQKNFVLKTKSFDSTVSQLDQRMSALDKSITESKDAKDKADKLVQRVQAVEEKQKAIEQNELNIFQANYQSAMVNLVSMDREIKPLLLFNSTKAFFNSLSETGNPMNYDGFTNGIIPLRPL